MMLLSHAYVHESRKFILTFGDGSRRVSGEPAGRSAPAKSGMALSFPSLSGVASSTTEEGALMSHARKSRPARGSSRYRLPNWLRDALRPAAHLLAVSLAVAVLNGVGVAPATRECPGGGSRPPVVVAGLRSDASTMPQSGGASSGGVSAAKPLSWENVVGRDGIEPPTLRFSAG